MLRISMFRDYRSAIPVLPVVTALAIGLACAARNPQSKAAGGSPDSSPCASALAQGAVCDAANKHALEIMRASDLEAATVVQDVRTGALLAFAATQSPNVDNKRAGHLDVTSPVLPLSVAKLFLAASWWDHNLPESSFDCIRNAPAPGTSTETVRMTVHEMIVIGCDSAAKQMAVALRKSVGTEAVLVDLKRFGFGQRSNSGRDDSFWAEIAPEWRARMVPASPYTLLAADSKDAEWADTLSIGENNFIVTLLHVSRFLQAVGNNGLLLPPVARLEVSRKAGSLPNLQVMNARRVMQESTALRLQAAMREVVQRGSAQSIAHTLDGAGWQIGGKTGTGPGPAPIGPQSDGWFAGLVFNPQGQARFTVATYVRHGGRGGGNAAKISADLALYLLGEKTISVP